jgi:hypothetical protein
MSDFDEAVEDNELYLTDTVVLTFIFWSKYMSNVEGLVNFETKVLQVFKIPSNFMFNLVRK